MHRFKIRDRVKVKIDIGRNKYTGFTGTYAGDGASSAADENPFVWVKLDGVPGNTVFRLKELEPHQDTKPHRHAELIKKWADNPKLKLQWRELGIVENWIDVTGSPAWSINVEYRIKPEPKPDVVRYARAWAEHNRSTRWTDERTNIDNIKATFDGETGKLKDVEII